MRGGSRGVRALLASATLIPIVALGWLGVRVLDQDRALERQRRRERLEITAGRVALALHTRLAGIEEQLAIGAGMHFSASGIDGDTLYQPVTISLAEPSFEAAEQAEYARNDL